MKIHQYLTNFATYLERLESEHRAVSTLLAAPNRESEYAALKRLKDRHGEVNVFKAYDFGDLGE